jgi:hypothetical protein
MKFWPVYIVYRCSQHNRKFWGYAVFSKLSEAKGAVEQYKREDKDEYATAEYEIVKYSHTSHNANVRGAE